MTPDFTITADGRDITALVQDRLIRLTLSDEVGAQSDTCRLELDDRDGAVEYPRPEAALEIALGWRGEGLAPMGRWIVDERGRSGPPDTLAIGATAADMAGPLRVPRTRDWDQATLSDVVGKMAAEAGLEPRLDRALGAVVLPHLDQIDESDLSILRRIARDLDLVARPAAGQLVVLPREEALAAATPAQIRRAEATDYRAVESERSRYDAVVAHYRDPAATTPPTVREGQAGSNVFRLRGIWPDAAQARNAAAARLRALRRAALTADVTLARGRPALAADLPITLHDFGPPLDARWAAQRVTHTLDQAAGLVTRLSLQRLSGPPWQRRSSTPTT